MVLYYDWLLTLPLEIDRFWKRRLTGPTVLFILNRYYPIVTVIPELIAYFTDTFSPEVRILLYPVNSADVSLFLQV